MGMLLAFAPFLVFAVIDRLAGSATGLVAGAIVSAVLLARDWIIPGRTPKILEIGTALLFGALAAYALLRGPAWSIAGIKLCVDAGLLLIVLLSMALGRPFTLQYARERVARDVWHRAEFVRTNTVITAIWALAFVVMVMADLVLLLVPELPPSIGVIATILTLAGAVAFTGRYPPRL